MRTLVLSALLVTTTALFAAGQQQTVPRPPSGNRDTIAAPPLAGTASITGTITSGTAGRPMRRATVKLQSSTSPLSRTTKTDDQGKYEFKDLAAGEFTLRANKSGYLESIYGQKRPGNGRAGTPLSVKDAQRLEKIDLSIPKGAALTGTIVDDLGEPVSGVQVRAMRYAFKNGEKSMVSAGTDTTDDRGIYRIATLVPGDYVLMATPRDDDGPAAELHGSEQAAGAGGHAFTFAEASRSTAPSPNDAPLSTGYAPVFYPSTTLAMSASTISLGPSEERAGLDVQLQLVPLGTITGLVSGDPRVVQSTTIELRDSNAVLLGVSAQTTRPGADGRFTFSGVAPGQYTLAAKSGNSGFVYSHEGGSTHQEGAPNFAAGRSGGGTTFGGPSTPPQWAKADVSVEGRVNQDVSLALQPGMSVSGHIKFDGTGQAPTDLTSMRVTLASTTQGGVLSGSAVGQVDTDGNFRVPDVMPGKYRISITPPRGWRATSVDIDTRDALDFMVDVKANEDIANAVATLTNKPVELTGILQDSSGRPTSDYTIILFAAEQKYWTPQSRRILSTRPSTNGKFFFRDVPAGDYQLIALDDAEPDSWFDVNVLRQLVGPAMSVAIIAGEKKTQDIRVR